MEVRVAKLQFLPEETNRNSWINVFKDLKWSFSEIWLIGSIDVFTPAYEYVLNSEADDVEIYFPFIVRTTSEVKKVFIDSLELPLKRINYGNRFIVGSGKKVFRYADEKKISNKTAFVKFEAYLKSAGFGSYFNLITAVDRELTYNASNSIHAVFTFTTGRTIQSERQGFFNSNFGISVSKQNQTTKEAFFTNVYAFNLSYIKELLQGFLYSSLFSLFVNKEAETTKEALYNAGFNTQVSRRRDCNRRPFYTISFLRFTTEFIILQCSLTTWQKFNINGWMSCETWVAPSGS